AFADSLPDHIGSVTMILVPENVADKAGFRQTIEFLSKETTSYWLKFLVIDDRKSPLLENIEESDPDITCQDFHMAPEEIERRTKVDLDFNPNLTSEEKRQYTGLLASFCFARKEYNEALRLQEQLVGLFTADVPPGEQATGLYNLANTLLARKELEKA